ncbi:MAG: DNA cytosine methyltransferase [Alphaproteobacteria bacterium]|nr:DNA cytosine methyltransferase [Alphaproteobacteria bacterium]
MIKNSGAKKVSYPIIDVFAGPGGLGEGFAALGDEEKLRRFKTAISIERDEHAHSTLLLRHFFRHFPEGEAPEDYYAYLSNRIDREELFIRHPEAADAATSSAVKLSLGPDTRKRVSNLINIALSKRKDWVLVGGPPCQAYSLVGRSRMQADPRFQHDERHFLYREYLQIIADHRPPVFVMENVKGLLSARVQGELMIDRILEDLAQPVSALSRRRHGLRYNLYSLSQPDVPNAELEPSQFLVRAEKYGVPQARHRMFIVGIRSDIDVRPEALRLHTAPTVSETISDLPEVRSGLSRQKDSYELWSKAIDELSKMGLERQLNGSPFAKDIVQRINELAESGYTTGGRSSSKYVSPRSTNHPSIAMLTDRRLGVLTGHEARSHMSSDLQRYAFAATFAEVTARSPKLGDFPSKLLPDHRNVDQGRNGKMFADRFRVQMPDAVSTTITSHISKDGHYFIHYDPRQCRSLTVREAARLQTFPDNYKFEGPRTAQYHQVGNAVPAYLAKQIAAVIANVLDRAGKIT